MLNKLATPVAGASTDMGTNFGFAEVSIAPVATAQNVSFFLGSPGAGSGVHNKIEPAETINLDGAFTIAFKGFSVDMITAGGSARNGICGDQLNYTLNTPTASRDGGRVTTYDNNLRIDTNTQVSSNLISMASVNVEDTGADWIITRDVTTNLVHLFINGTEIGTATIAGRLPINRIMGNPDGSGYFGWSGSMRQFRIWSKALDSGERTTIINDGHVSDSCELWYKMNEKSGTTITDYSGNGRHGTLSNHDTNTFFQTVLDTDNVVLNGGFNNVTGNDFANWTEQTDGGVTNYVQNSSGRVNIITEAGAAPVTGVVNSSALTTGKRYRILLYITTVTSGGCYIYNASGSLSSTYTTTGWKIWDVNAISGTLGLYRASGGDADNVILANVQVMRI